MSIGTVLLIVLCNMSSFRASKVLVTLFGIELGASQVTIGVVIAMYSLLPALLAMYAGRLSDRLGVRVPMLAGSLGVAAGLLLPWLQPGLPALYASAALIGASHMFYNVSAQNLIGSLGGAEERGLRRRAKAAIEHHAPARRELERASQGLRGIAPSPA